MSLRGRKAGRQERRRKSTFFDAGTGEICFLAKRGSSRGTKQDQTVSLSAAARKARETAAAWQAATGDVSEITRTSISSGRRPISQDAVSMDDGSRILQAPAATLASVNWLWACSWLRHWDWDAVAGAFKLEFICRGGRLGAFRSVPSR